VAAPARVADFKKSRRDARLLVLDSDMDHFLSQPFSEFFQSPI
jgi:hypothetical protein